MMAMVGHELVPGGEEFPVVFGSFEHESQVLPVGVRQDGAFRPSVPVSEGRQTPEIETRLCVGDPALRGEESVGEREVFVAKPTVAGPLQHAERNRAGSQIEQVHAAQAVLQDSPPEAREFVRRHRCDVQARQSIALRVDRCLEGLAPAGAVRYQRVEDTWP